MPTGYTAKLVEKGQSFKEFVMDCARAFGACITLRDDPFGTKIPEKFEPSDYHMKELAGAKNNLMKLEAMSSEERTAYGDEEKKASVKEAKRHLKINSAENKRLSDMKVEVSKWVPPSSEHKEMKKFMLQQLDVSYHDLSWAEGEVAKAEARSSGSYFEGALILARRNIQYHQEELVEEQDRVNERNEWVRLLRKSLEAGDE